MEITNEYNKLCQKIYELRRSYYMERGIEPNTVNLGYDEFYTLKTGNQLLIENTPRENTGDYIVFGMKIKRVAEDSYLSVGYMLE